MLAGFFGSDQTVGVAEGHAGGDQLQGPLSGVNLGGEPGSTGLLVEFETGQNALYDLANDPYEMTNVAGGPAYAAVAEELSRRLAELLACSGASCRAVEDAPIESKRANE